MDTEVRDQQQKPGKPRDFWQSESGRSCRRWFECWGEVVRERRDSGDSSAVPSLGSGLAGHNRCGPSDVSSMVLYHSAVDVFLGKAIPVHRDLMRFIYVDSIDWAESRTYYFPDGTMTDPLPLDAPPPAAYERCHTEMRVFRRYDLARFDAPEVAAFLRRWYPGTTVAAWLDMQHLRIARNFAEVQGL